MAAKLTPMTLGERLLAKMAANGLSQQQVAHDLEVTRGAVWQWIYGYRFPSRRHQRALALYLATTIDALHYGAS